MLTYLYVWLFFWPTVSPQPSPAKQPYTVYSALIDYYYSRYPYAYVWVGDKTYAQLLKEFNFKNLPNDSFPDKRLNILLTPAWRHFLTSIDISKAKDSPLTQSFTSSIPTKFWKGPFRVGMRVETLFWPLTIKDYKRPRDMTIGGILGFSPVFFSKDGCRAVFLMNRYLGPDNGGTSIHFFEKQPDGKWKQVAEALTSIS